MVLRALAIAGGVLGGAAASQFPEYSQQYIQRLGGAVDALEEVITDFDASAQAEGMTRDEALTQMQGSEFIERRREDMTRTFQRYDRLSEDLALLEGAGAMDRVMMAARMTDREVAQAAFEAFEPAMPLTASGASFAGGGFLAGLAAIWASLKLVLWPFGRKRAAA